MLFMLLPSHLLSLAHHYYSELFSHCQEKSRCMMATFEERLNQLRTQKNLSQQTLADYLGVSRWSVHNYESGKNRPDYEGLIKLADYFEVSLDYLTGRSDT